jgi:glycerol-3-phosphate acyltransferase PlsY
LISIYATVAVVSYLLGSIPFGYILVKLFLKQDIRQTGSGNIGATNVARSGRKGLAIATLLLDAGKGALAVVAANAMAHSAFNWKNDFYVGPSVLLAIAALGALCGHIFPVWLKFKGGKGVATGLGGFLALAPKSVLIALLAFIVVFALLRYVSLGSVIAAAAFPFATWWLYPENRSASFIALISAAALLIVIKHHANIRRLLNGTEPKFGARKNIPADPIQAEKNA